MPATYPVLTSVSKARTEEWFDEPNLLQQLRELPLVTGQLETTENPKVIPLEVERVGSNAWVHC